MRSPSRREPVGLTQGIVTLILSEESLTAARRVDVVTLGDLTGRSGVSLSVSRPGRGSDRRGQAPKGTGGMPRRHQRIRRGRLRNVRGSCPTSVDPGIPEATQGTETSQYLEERKSTETPSVAASERGRA